jgi:hypothetical protein
MHGIGLLALMAAACTTSDANAATAPKKSAPKAAVVSHPATHSSPTVHVSTPHTTVHSAPPARVSTPHNTSSPSVSTVHTSPSVSTSPGVGKVIRNQNQAVGTGTPTHTPTGTPVLSPNTTHPVIGAPLAPNLRPVAGAGAAPARFGQLHTGPVATNMVRPSHPVIFRNNVYFPIIRTPYFVYTGGIRRFFVPVAALGVAYIGGTYWDPDGYVSVARRYCSGVSENGCNLHWRMVDFANGGSEQQCVQYCPHSGPPPAKFAELPPPPPPPPANASCQLAIFADPNFGGASAPTGDAQPDLAVTGWQNAISSIQIKSGTWDFFTDANFGGASMRLQAGPVPNLPPDWDKKIGSFQCVQIGPAV